MKQSAQFSKAKLRLHKAGSKTKSGIVLSFTALSFFSILPGISVFVGPEVGYGQQSGVVGQTEREIRIREERCAWAQSQTAKASDALANNDFESAFALAKSAVDAIPSDGDASQGLRKLAQETFSKASLALAKQRISEGRFEDAELVVSAATGNPYNSTYKPLLDLQAQLRDPNQFNRTMTPESIAKVEEVKQLHSEAQGLYASGRYNAAFKDYEKILNLDPDNTAARLGMEQINKQRSDYASEAYNERRGQMLGDVARAWELPVPKFDTGASTIVEQNPIDMKGTSGISRKLQEIIIPQLSLQDETVRDAIDKLQKKSRLLDNSETDPSKKGVNIVLKLDPTKESADGGTKINLSLSSIPLGEALKYIASAANLKVKIEPYAVAIVPLSEPIETLIAKEYNVPPSFISSAPSTATPPPSTPGLPGTTTVGTSGAKEFLESQGVTFPLGSTATYLPSSSKLLVKNTQANLDLIDSLVEVSLATPPSQIQIESRFLEVTQNNLQELGFDWLLGSFNIPGTGIYMGGGTVGNQTVNSGTVPFNNGGSPVGSINGTGTGNMTAGNRTGSAAIAPTALANLLAPTALGPAAGVLALAGIFTNPQFQVVLRAINQQKGIDLVSAPKVTVTSGRNAVINIARRFPYPKVYSPPQIPQSTGIGTINPVSPATPTSFETRDVGVQLEVTPTVGPDGYTIELSLSPQVVEFEGFVNYGTPINTISPTFIDLGGGLRTQLGSQQVLLTENVIDQPVFSVRQVDTQVTLYDGQTVVLGGLLREDVQKVQDKTPILGDMPLVGGLFRSSNNQRIKRNLLMFVTAGLLDAYGQPLIKEVEEGQEVLAPNAKAVTAEAIPGDPSTASVR
jgi:general secretion pathway protein D